VVSDISRLRVYVNVPQRQVAAIKVGDKAELSVPERPGKTYTATVQALAQAINASSGAMQVQLTVQNDSRELLPGGYASIHFDAPLASSALSIPPSALIFNKAGTQVATLGKDDRVVLKPITVGRDLGNVLEIASGIDRNDRVIANPPDGVATGDAVRVAAATREGQAVKILYATTLALALAACAQAPVQQPPAVPLADSFRDIPPAGPMPTPSAAAAGRLVDHVPRPTAGPAGTAADRQQPGPGQRAGALQQAQAATGVLRAAESPTLGASLNGQRIRQSDLAAARRHLAGRVQQRHAAIRSRLRSRSVGPHQPAGQRRRGAGTRRQCRSGGGAPVAANPAGRHPAGPARRRCRHQAAARDRSGLPAPGRTGNAAP
jgi:hypothetical protein